MQKFIEFIQTLPGIVSSLAVMLGTIYAGYAFIKWRGKLNKEREIAEAKRDVKVANVEGESAELNKDDVLMKKLDELTIKIVSQTDDIVKLMQKVHLLSKNDYDYKTFVNRIYLKCEDYCETSNLCKEKIVQELERLGLPKPNTESDAEIKD